MGFDENKWLTGRRGDRQPSAHQLSALLKYGGNVQAFHWLQMSLSFSLSSLSSVIIRRLAHVSILRGLGDKSCLVKQIFKDERSVLYNGVNVRTSWWTMEATMFITHQNTNVLDRINNIMILPIMGLKCFPLACTQRKVKESFKSHS